MGVRNGFFTQKELDRVMAESDIGDVWERLRGARVKEKADGLSRVPCILRGHRNETDRDMVLNHRHNLFYCFHCHQGGNVIDLVKTVNGSSWVNAVYWLGAKRGNMA